MGRDNGTINMLSDDVKNCLKETEETNKVLSDRISQLYRTIHRCSFFVYMYVYMYVYRIRIRNRAEN